MPKSHSGIKRGSKSEGAAKMSPKNTKDKEYVIQTDWEPKMKKSGHYGLHIKSQSEGFKAVYDAPVGTRFSVSYLFGDPSLYEVRIRGVNTKVVQRIDPDGTSRARYRTIRSAASVRSLFKTAQKITIHGVRK